MRVLRRFHPMRVALLALLLTGLHPVAAPAQSASRVVDSLGTALTASHDGAAVIGRLYADTTAVQGFGAVDSTRRRPTAHTLFEIGSITKTVTGLLLAEAVERGVVEPTTPVRALLPDSVAWTYADSVHASAMTLEHLATHRAGLPRLPSNFGATARPADPYAAYDDRALFAYLDGAPLSRAPGTRYVYSNLGMGLLGHLLARRADTTYAALVRVRVTEPLGLSDTRVQLSAEQRRRVAQGHNRAGAPASPWHFEALAGAGALRSTAADMLTYLRAHRRALRTSGDTPPLRRAMRRAVTPHASTGREDTRIGYGWHQSVRDGHAVLWHNGGTGGYRSFVGLNRETGRGVVVLVSAAVASDRVTEAGQSLLRALRPE